MMHLRTEALRYGAALLAVAVAALLRWALPGVLEGTPYLAFYPAVVASAGLFGRGPGLFATIAGLACVDLLFDATPGWIDLGDPVVLGRTVIFLASGIGTSVVVGIQRERQAREREQARDLAEVVRLLDLATVLVRDLDDRIQRWSTGCQRLYGFTAEEALGQVSHELLRTRFSEPLETIRATLMTTGRWEGELVHTTLDGREIVVTSEWVLWREAPSQAAAILEADTEITDRKQREEELRQLNRTLRALRNSGQVMLLAADEAEYLDQVCRIIQDDCGHAMIWIGYAEDDVGKTVRPVAWAGFEEGYLETLNITWADAERGRGPTGTAIRTGKPAGCPNMLTDPGFEPWREQAIERGYASSIALPLLSAGKVFGAITIYASKPDAFSDDEAGLLSELADDLAYGVTAIRLRMAHAQAEEAMRQSEERYRGLVELAPDAIYVNRDNRIVYVNPAALQLFGADAVEQLVGKSPFDVFHPDCHARVEERIAKVLAGQVVRLSEDQIVRLDGSVRDVEVAASLVIDQHGPANQVILRDITDRKRAAETIRLTAEELVRSNKDLEQFAYVASHDLQEPLRMVTGYMQLLSERYRGQLDERADKYIAYAVDGATRMSTLIRDLLAYSRVSTRGEQFGPIESGEAMKRAVRNLDSAIKESAAVITQDPLPVILADKTQLVQLFQNLIGNAIKFRLPGRPAHIHVSARKEPGQWLFSVQDNGVGFEQQYEDKLFLLFQRLHSRKEYPGTGMGLAICKRIIERHGGRIWATGEPDQGSTFFFTIPA